MTATATGSVTLHCEGRPGHLLVASKDKFKRPIVLKNGKLRTRWKLVLGGNGRSHEMEKYRCMQQDIEAVIVAVNKAGFRPQRWERAQITVTLYVTAAQRRDDGNMRGTLKGIEDGLVRAGVIADDNMSVIGTPEVRIEMAPEYGYEIRVTEVRDGE